MKSISIDFSIISFAFLMRLRYLRRQDCRLSKIWPARGLPAAFQSLFDSTEASLRMDNSSFHQNLNFFYDMQVHKH